MKSKSKGNNKYFNYHKEEHYMRNCAKHKEKENDKASNFGDAIVVEENPYTINILSVIVGNLGDEWILDSRCSYHMSPNKD